MNQNTQAFADCARRFCEWARASQPTGPVAAAEALRQIASLYAAGLSLPEPWSTGVDPHAKRSLIQPEERHAVVDAAARIPFQYYSEVFNPFLVPAEEAVLGDITDDLADIYCDVASGLLLYDAGKTADAVWQWGFHLQIHWGEHATSAIRALHCYVAQEAPELLGHGG